MAITTNHGHAWLCDSQFWPNHMNDPLVGMIKSIERDAMLLTILSQFIYLESGEFVLYGEMLVNRGDVVVGSGHCMLRSEYADPPLVDPGKSLGTGYFMNQMLIYIEYRRASFNLFHHMGIPDFVK